jgi:hypothetical protein
VLALIRKVLFWFVLFIAIFFVLGFVFEPVFNVK